METKNRKAIAPELLEYVNGGVVAYDPDGNGTYTMTFCFSGDKYPGISLYQVIQIAQYSSAIPNTAEGEKQISAWAKEQGIIP